MRCTADTRIAITTQELTNKSVLELEGAVAVNSTTVEETASVAINHNIAVEMHTLDSV